MRAIAMGLMLLAAVPVAAQEGRIIQDHGRFSVIEEAELKPDPNLRYRVIFEVKAAPVKADAPHQGYEKVARMVNLLGTNGVTLHPGDLVVAVHGPAYAALMNDEAYAKRHDGAANPSRELLMELMKAGVELRLCGQSARARNVTRADLLPGVKIDTSAITTMATLQLKGWVMIQD